MLWKKLLRSWRPWEKMGQVKRVQPAQAHSAASTQTLDLESRSKTQICDFKWMGNKTRSGYGVISLEIEMEDTHSKNEAEIGWIQLLSHGVWFGHFVYFPGLSTLLCPFVLYQRWVIIFSKFSLRYAQIIISSFLVYIPKHCNNQSTI